MKRYQEIIGTINYWLFLLLIVVLPYPSGVIRPVWVAWLVAWLLEFRWLQRPVLNKARLKELLPLIGLVVLVVWEALSSAWAANPASAWALVGRHINFAAVLLIAIFGTNEQYKAATMLKALVLTAVTSVGVYLMMHFWLDNTNAALIKGYTADNMIDWLHLETLTYDMKHRLHYATLLTLSLVSLLFIMRDELQHREPWKVYLLTILACLVLLAGIYWSGSRANMVNVVAVFSLWVIWHTPNKWKPAAGAGLVLLIAAIGWGALHYYPRFAGQDAKDIFAYDAAAETPAFEPRIGTWHAALEQPADYVGYGLGAGNSTDYLVDRYTEKGWTEYVEHAYSPHNQYLTICMDLGIVAAILFLALWLCLPFCHKGRARLFALYATVIIMLNMLTDMYLGVIEGILLTCIVLLIINRMDQEQQPIS